MFYKQIFFYMHRIQSFVTIIILQYCFFLFAKETFGSSKFDVDSLKNAITIHLNDTNKINSLLLLVNEVRNYDPKSAMQYCYEAYRLSKDLNFEKGELSALIKQSYLFQNLGNIDSATICITEYKNISESLKDTARMANSYLQLGNLMRIKGETMTAREYFVISLEMFKQIHDTTGLVSAYISIGVIHKNICEFDSAAYYYLKALDLSERTNYDKGIGPTLINLGKIYLEMKDYENAKIYTQRSIEYNQKSNNIIFIALAYTNLGMIASDEEDLDKAMEYYNKAIELNRQINSEIEINNLLNNIGNIYKKRKDYKKALENYNAALSVFRKINYNSGMISALMNKASVYSLQGKLQDAIKMYDSCLILTYKSGDKEKRRETYQSIYLSYQHSGNFTKAFEYFEKYHYLNDSIYNLNKEKVIANLTLKYEKEKDQARILSLENENLAKDLDLRKKTNQRNGYLYSGVGVVLILSFIFIFYRHNAIKDKIIADQKIKQLEEEKKLLAARSIVDGQENERKRIAIELHDGLGVLLSTAKMQFSAIRDKSPENMPLIERASKLLEQATSDVRKISHNMMPGILTKFGFFEAVEDLFEQINDTDDIDAKILIEGETNRLPDNMEIMLYRVVQELVNNTLKHAGAHNVSMIIKILQDQLYIQFSDDGKGFVVEEKVDSKSIGLDSIFSRVKFLNGNVNLESKPGKGCTYFIRIPHIISN
jgi:two-component system, NarL family, sensor kinase